MTLIDSLRQTLRTFVESERGQGLVEYSLILLLVATALTGALAAFGADVEGLFDFVADAFP
jgi:Flp pilus assembly pilin Flp